MHPIKVKGGHFVVATCAVSVCTFGEDPHDNLVLQVGYSNLVNIGVMLKLLCHSSAWT